MDDTQMTDKTFRAGFATLVGRPNVGKSSLINALLHEKTAAVSDKPQTTRNAVRCILTTETSQIVFVDTPGLHRPKHKLGEFMMREAESALSEVDVVCFVVEAGHTPDDEDIRAAELVNTSPAPKILIVNKVDKLRDKEDFWRALPAVTDLIKPSAVVPVSAREGTNLDVLTEEIAKHLPTGELLYPEDMLMDTTERFLAEEMIREKIFHATEQEVPHSVAVMVEEFKSPDEYPDMKTAVIRANILVERPGQKGILIGAGGSKLKEIRRAARLEMQERFGWPVELQLWVKVKPGWRKSDVEMARAGYKNR